MAKISRKMGVAIALILLAVSLLGVGMQDMLSVYSYVKEVPIQLGYNEVENYWVLSSVVAEMERFKMVLHTDDTEEIDSDTQAKAQSEVGILLNPLMPTSETNLEVSDYTFVARTGLFGYGEVSTKVPAYDVADAGWLTTARYTISLYKNGLWQVSRTVDVNYKEPRVVTLQVGNSTVTVNNLGILPQGVEVPSGDLVVILDPYEKAHVVDKADLLRMIDRWYYDFMVDFPLDYQDPVKIFEWYEVWAWAEENGLLPSDVTMPYVSVISYEGDYDYIKLYYSDIVFAGAISIYVPSALADTIIVNLFEPKPEIIKIEPTAIPTIYEGDSFTLAVTIRNIGTEGTISVNLQGERYVANPITETFANFEEDETLTFRWMVYALNVEAETLTQLKVTAQGRGGIVEQTLIGMIKDKPDYTPPTPDPPPDPVPPMPPTPEIPFWLIIVGACMVVLMLWYYKGRKK